MDLTIDSVQSEWAKDSVLDHTSLDSNSLDAGKLHSKYLNLYSRAKLALKAVEKQRDKLFLEKYRYFSGDMDKEALDARKWKPNQKLIIKSDVDKYISADEEMSALELKLEYHTELVSALREILSAIKGRSYHIRNAIEFMKFMSGS